jgi:hypothetical protein
MLITPWTLQLNASAKAIPRRVSYRTNPELSNNALCAPPGSPKSLGRTRSDLLKDQSTGAPGIPCPSILIDLPPVERAPVVTRGPHVTPGNLESMPLSLLFHCFVPVTDGIPVTLGAFCMREATAKVIACAKHIGAVMDRDKGPGCS